MRFLLFLTFLALLTYTCDAIHIRHMNRGAHDEHRFELESANQAEFEALTSFETELQPPNPQLQKQPSAVSTPQIQRQASSPQIQRQPSSNGIVPVPQGVTALNSGAGGEASNTVITPGKTVTTTQTNGQTQTQTNGANQGKTPQQVQTPQVQSPQQKNTNPNPITQTKNVAPLITTPQKTPLTAIKKLLLQMKMRTVNTPQLQRAKASPQVQTPQAQTPQVQTPPQQGTNVSPKTMIGANQGKSPQQAQTPPIQRTNSNTPIQTNTPQTQTTATTQNKTPQNPIPSTIKQTPVVQQAQTTITKKF